MSSTTITVRYDEHDLYIEVGPGRPAQDPLRPGRTDHTVRGLGTLHRHTGATGRISGWAATSTGGQHSGEQQTRVAALTWLLDEDGRRAEAARARKKGSSGTEAAASRAAHQAWQQANRGLERAAEHGTEDEVAAARAEEERTFRAYRAARTAEAAARTAARG